MLRAVASKQLKRGLASQAKGALAPEISQLSNGLTVATECNPAAASASVGFVFGSGSASENPYNNGISNLLSKSYKSVGNRQLAASKGAEIVSVVGREHQSYLVNSLPGQLAKSLDLLNETVLANPTGSESVFEQTKKDVLAQLEHFEENDHKGRVLEHLHATAFQNTPLSLPIRGTQESVEGLLKSDLDSFAEQHFLASNAVVVGTGNVSHQELCDLVEKSTLKFNTTNKSKPEINKKSTFLGSEVRLRDDTLPKAWIAIAAEGEALSSPDYLVSQVAAKIFGSYNAFEPNSRLQGIKLLDDIQEYQLCDDFSHFSKSYRDAGLWGFITTTQNVGAIDDLMHFTLKQWNRLTVSVTDTEVARGKALLKLKLANECAKKNCVIATELGNLVLNQGAKFSQDEVFRKIDAITVKDVKAWASKRLWDQDIAIAGTGQIEGLLDYMRLRNDMSMMRW